MQKIHRLRLKKDINFVFKKNRTIRGQIFYLKYAYSDKNFFRFAVVVSLKISKKATIRNKIRRQIREAVYAYQKFIPPVDFLIFVQKSALDKKFNKIKEEIFSLISKISASVYP